MKKLLPILLGIILFATACHPVATEQQTRTADSLMTRVIRALLDPDISCLDYQDEFMMLVDTLQLEVESSPDEDVRIAAEGCAMYICEIILFGDHTQEEKCFFDDSLLPHLMDIQSTWYLPAYVPNEITDPFKEPVLTQTTLFTYNPFAEHHVICLDLYFFPSGDEGMVVTLPIEAEKLESIMFGNKDDIDLTQLFRIEDATDFRERSEDLGQVIWFGKDFIDAMLTYDVMYIVYKGTENTEEIYDSIHSCNLILHKFHQQYQQVRQLMNR